MDTRVENFTDKKLPKEIKPLMDSKVNIKLPDDIWLTACLTSMFVGGLFGLWYGYPGMIFGSLGGLLVSIAWCCLMNHFYCKMEVKWRWLLLTGITAAIIAGIIDGIMLNILVVYSIKAKIFYTDSFLIGIPKHYSSGIIIGCIFGAIGGLLNSLLCSLATVALYREDKEKME